MREFWWTATAQYPGRKNFLFGSVKATGVEHARKLLAKRWETVSPHPAPEIFGVTKGRLALQSEESE